MTGFEPATHELNCKDKRHLNMATERGPYTGAMQKHLAMDGTNPFLYTWHCTFFLNHSRFLQKTNNAAVYISLVNVF